LRVVEREGLGMVTRGSGMVKTGSAVEFARAMSRALRSIEDAPEGMADAARMVTDRVAAARLGVSVDVLRRDRKSGKLGIPFIKLGEGKRGLIRYDLADLDSWIAGMKQVGKAEPRVVEHADEPPVPEPEEPVAPIDPRPRRHFRSPWEAIAEAAMDEPEEDPFATGGRSAPRRKPGGYFSG
jgi:hypothetical protein